MDENLHPSKYPVHQVIVTLRAESTHEDLVRTTSLLRHYCQVTELPVETVIGTLRSFTIPYDTTALEGRLDEMPEEWGDD